MDIDENLDNKSSSTTQTVSGTASSVVDAAAVEPTEARSVNNLLAECQPIAVAHTESCPIDILTVQKTPFTTAGVEAGLANVSLADTNQFQ